MSKIAIISRGNQAILVDISGCSTFKEAIEQLSSTLLSTNQFWQGQPVDLNLGSLVLTKPQTAQIIALANGVGASPKQVFARSAQTLVTLEELGIPFVKGSPEQTAQVSSVALLETENLSATENQSVVKTEETKASQEQNQDSEMDTTLGRIVMLEEGPKADLAVDTPQTEKTQTLYLKQTLRAGQAVSHKGDLIIIGDVNAGAEVSAEGDITIWGSLRGIAHAGVGGNTNAEIRALRLQPIQIRIAHLIARSPDQAQVSGSIGGLFIGITAETAKLVDGKIRILRNTLD